MRDGVEGATDDTAGGFTGGRLSAGEHVVGGPPGERQQQDPARLDALLVPKPGRAGNQSARLARAGSGENEQWAALMRGRRELIGVEAIEYTGESHHARESSQPL